MAINATTRLSFLKVLNEFYKLPFHICKICFYYDVIFINTCCTLFDIFNEYRNQYGLKNKSQLTERFEICTPTELFNQ